MPSAPEVRGTMVILVTGAELDCSAATRAWPIRDRRRSFFMGRKHCVLALVARHHHDYGFRQVFLCDDAAVALDGARAASLMSWQALRRTRRR
jgi:hypothetical protein